ncbi:MAG: META domain-containing protein [Rhizobiaceae bacterium]
MDTTPHRPQKPVAGPRRTAAFLLLAAILFPAPVLADGGDLYGSWLAEDIEGGGVIDRLKTVLELSDDGTVGGTGGCNRFGGRADISGQRIVFKPLAATSMACVPAAMNQEGKFFEALGKVASWRVDAPRRKLVLMDAGEKALVVLSRMD